MSIERLNELRVVEKNAAGDVVSEFIVGADMALYNTKPEIATLLSGKTDTAVTLALIDRVIALEEVDLSMYATNTVVTAIADRVTDLENEVVDLSAYSTTEEMNTALATKANNSTVTAIAADLDALEAIVAKLDNLTPKVVEALPAIADADPTILYLVPAGDGSMTTGYLFSEGEFYEVSTIDVDMSGYPTYETLTTALAEKADLSALNMLVSRVNALDSNSVSAVTVNGTTYTPTAGEVSITIGTASFEVVTDTETGAKRGVITFE